MNIIHINYKWVKSALNVPPITPQERLSLINHYALKDLRIAFPNGNPIDLWLSTVDMGDYGTHEAIFIHDPTDFEYEWHAILCSDTELTEKFHKNGLVCFKKYCHGDDINIGKLDKEATSTVLFWFLINRDILKRYKTVIKLGKRRHQIQEMGEKQAAKYQQKPIRIADGISYTWEYENPRTFNRHCEAWGVRGHYRHYKSGKVVYIQPYTKGSGRLKDSHYEL